jgi:hypothetical protein
VLSDGCAAFSDAVHEATLVSLGTIAALTTCAELQAYLGTGAG